MLFKTLFLLFAVLLVSKASPDILYAVRAENGLGYALRPIDGDKILDVHRQKRETIGGTLYKNDRHKVDGYVFKEGATSGGGLKYTNDKVDVGLGTEHAKGGSTAIRADVRGILFENKKHRLEGNANWEREYAPGAGFSPATVGVGARYSNNRAELGLHAQHTKGSGTNVRADIKGTLLEKNNHKLEGNAKYEQSFGARAGPATVGAGLRYSNDKAHLGLNAQHTRGYGTDVGANAGVTMWSSKNGDSSFEGNAFYNRHIGGPPGSPKSDYGGSILFKKKF